jgi:hypothetical protein
MTALAGRAFSLVRKRLPLYAGVGALVIAAQAAIYALRIPNALAIGGFLIDPIFVTIVYAFVLADTRDTATPYLPWARVLERLWAVIVIDFLVTLLQIQLYGFSTDIVGVLAGAAIGLFSALFMLADASAVIDDEHDWLLLIPRSFGRSFSLSWRPVIFRRVLILYVLLMLINALSYAVQSALVAHHVAFADFWATVPVAAVVTPPLAALTALVYMDASGMQPERSCDG